MSEVLTLVTGKRTTEPVRIKFRKENGDVIYFEATKITTKPVKIRFQRSQNTGSGKNGN